MKAIAERVEFKIPFSNRFVKKFITSEDFILYIHIQVFSCSKIVPALQGALILLEDGLCDRINQDIS